MSKSKKFFLTLLSVFLLSGAFGTGPVSASSQPGEVNPGGGGGGNVSRFLNSGGAPGTATRPWAEASITVAMPNIVRQARATVHLGTESATNNLSYLIGSFWTVGSRATTVRLTGSDRVTPRQTATGVFEYRRGSNPMQRLADITRTWP